VIRRARISCRSRIHGLSLVSEVISWNYISCWILISERARIVFRYEIANDGQLPQEIVTDARNVPVEGGWGCNTPGRIYLPDPSLGLISRAKILKHAVPRQSMPNVQLLHATISPCAVTGAEVGTIGRPKRGSVGMPHRLTSSFRN